MFFNDNPFLAVCCACLFQKYCVDEMDSPASIFACLRRNKEEENFDPRCLKMIVLREEERAQGWSVNDVMMLMMKLFSHCGCDDVYCGRCGRVAIRLENVEKAEF